MPETLPAVSDETREMIEDHVKKGKARKFFLISKGANISTLEVFKKGPFGPRIMKAKKDGFKGEVTYGVVTGAGKELYFQLAGNQAVAEVMKVDSFAEEPPTKRAKLREFLSDNGLSFKCNYYIITDLSLAPDPEGEGTFAPPPASALAVADDEADDSPSAMYGQEGEVPTTPPSPTASPSDTNLFMERLKSLKPVIDRVVASGGPLADEVKLRVSEAGMFARKKDFDQANGILDKIEELLKQANAAPPVPPPSPSSDSSALFNKRLAEIVARVKEAAGTSQGDQAKLKVSEAAVFARKKEFEQANALLDEAEEILTQSGTPEISKAPLGAVSFAKARLNWQAAKKEVEGQLSRLQSAILAEFDDEEAIDGAKKLELVLARFNEGLSDSLDELYNAETDKKPPLAKSALQTVSNYIGYVESDELIAHIEENPYETLTVRSSLLDSLTEIQKQLQTVA